MTRAYYNEHDPFTAEWLRYLIAFGHIANGDVDERSIEDVRPNDLKGYTQCHFFAGIGGWSYALRLAGWPDYRPCWTGSCPCQPFSAAGKGRGISDERHLWPAFHWLIANCRPIEIFGEQVASKDGLQWLNLVQTDLENTGYHSGAIDLCAASIGAPHIRQRLYWAAHSAYGNQRSGISSAQTGARKNTERRGRSSGDSETLDCLNPITKGLEIGTEGTRLDLSERRIESDSNRFTSTSSATRGFWSPADWWKGRDDKYRPIEPGVFPLAHGVSARMGKLRGYGNAIVPQLAAEFIKAWQEIT